MKKLERVLFESLKEAAPEIRRAYRAVAAEFLFAADWRTDGAYDGLLSEAYAKILAPIVERRLGK